MQGSRSQRRRLLRSWRFGSPKYCLIILRQLITSRFTNCRSSPPLKLLLLNTLNRSKSFADDVLRLLPHEREIQGMRSLSSTRCLMAPRIKPPGLYYWRYWVLSSVS